MDVQDLIQGLPVQIHRGRSQHTRVTSIVDDSRRVRPGALFVARGGTNDDGRSYITDAVNRGAAAVLTDRPLPVRLRGTSLLLTDSPADTGIVIARRFYGDPAAKLALVGITGTNGKTTTAYMLRHLVRSAGRLAGLIGTVEVDTGDGAPTISTLTTPGTLDLLAMLAAMARNGCDTCIMETSSHALHQGRTRGLTFDAAVFTNLSGDHMDYHGTMDAYAEAKAILFDQLGDRATAVVNTDDARATRMLRNTAARSMHFGFNVNGEVDAGYGIRTAVHEATARHTDCSFAGPWGDLRVKLPLIGRHNVSNMAAALGAAHGMGIDVPSLRDAIESCPAVPGRLEMVRPTNGAAPAATVLVDYAHTDDALRNVLESLRPITPGKLRVLFGCGGDRDPGKRPRMASVACELADEVVITSDNPRTEDPDVIIQDILAGVPHVRLDGVQVNADRVTAIRLIITDAEPGDVVLIAGKGHEDYQIIGTEKRDFDDRVEARRVLDELVARHEATQSAISPLRESA